MSKATPSERWQSIMRGDWDARARTNAMHYIAAEQVEWNAATFFATGERQVARLLDPFLQQAGFDPAGKRLLEIGCGVGRLTRSLAERFAQVDALDVSPEMIANGRRLLPGYSNINWLVGNGTDLGQLPTAQLDCVFSFIVFQHLPAPELVLAYVTEIGRVLKPGGLFKFQLRSLTFEPLPLWQARVRFSVAAWRRLDRLLRLARRADLIGLNEAQDSLKSGRAHSWTGNAVPIPRLRPVLNRAHLSYKIAGAGSQYTWVSGRKQG